MEHRGPVLGSAHTRFNDYVGTVAADDAVALRGEPSLYELASIDRDLYTIVAVDLRVEGPVTATVYAVDRIAQGIGPHGDVAELGDGDGEIAVMAQSVAESRRRRSFARVMIMSPTLARFPSPRRTSSPARAPSRR